jgi:hypothetical protein
MANLINADPTNGLKLISDGSSEIQIQANGVAVATINSSGLSMNTGTLAGNGPAFSASQSTTTSMSSGVRTKLQFDTEDFDTNSCYDTSLYRFTPNVEGYYLITGACAFNLASGQMNVVIYKNGSALIWGNQFPNNTNLNIANVSTILYANGTTDYFECYGYQASGSTASNFIVSERFQGILARAA